MKSNINGLFMIIGWDDAWDEIVKESEIKEHLDYVKKNTGAKRLHWKFKSF